MSRSYRRVPRRGDQYHNKRLVKRLASKKVRQRLKHYEPYNDGSMYKRLFNSWDINDYKIGYWSFNDYIHSFTVYCGMHTNRDIDDMATTCELDKWYREWMK